MKVDVKDSGGLGSVLSDVQPGLLLIPLTAVVKALDFSTLVDLTLAG